MRLRSWFIGRAESPRHAELGSVPIGASQLLTRPRSDDVLAVDSTNGRRSALVFDLASAVPACRLITLPTAVARCAAMPGESSTFVALTPSGDLGLLSRDPTSLARPAPTATHLGALETVRPTRLFDDLFGASTLPPPPVSAPSRTSYDTPVRKLAGDDLFSAPAHVLPPMRMLWRHALQLRPSATSSSPVRDDDGAAAAAEAMDVDDPMALSAAVRDPPPLSTTEVEVLSDIFRGRLRVSAAAT